ncbi:RDAC family protein [Intestinimonas sp. HCP28S3_D6]|uniref:RDAC family protein n=1 Tax=Intestinimonas sp. HCP28S3_D6 TaxID=3438942 RepID=UPI003F89169B
MDIDYQDLILLNNQLREEGIRYHVTYKDHTTACLEPPGACCCTPEQKEGALRVICDYYRRKGIRVTFSGDDLYFILS